MKTHEESYWLPAVYYIERVCNSSILHWSDRVTDNVCMWGSLVCVADWTLNQKCIVNETLGNGLFLCQYTKMFVLVISMLKTNPMIIPSQTVSHLL